MFYRHFLIHFALHWEKHFKYLKHPQNFDVNKMLPNEFQQIFNENKMVCEEFCPAYFAFYLELFDDRKK